eukprot:gene4614-5057_t
MNELVKAVRKDLARGCALFLSKHDLRMQTFLDLWQANHLDELHALCPSRWEDSHFLQLLFFACLDQLLCDLIPQDELVSDGEARLALSNGALVLSLYLLYLTQRFSGRRCGQLQPIRVNARAVHLLALARRRIQDCLGWKAAVDAVDWMVRTGAFQLCANPWAGQLEMTSKQPLNEVAGSHCHCEHFKSLGFMMDEEEDPEDERAVPPMPVLLSQEILDNLRSRKDIFLQGRAQRQQMIREKQRQRLQRLLERIYTAKHRLAPFNLSQYQTTRQSTRADCATILESANTSDSNESGEESRLAYELEGRGEGEEEGGGEAEEPLYQMELLVASLEDQVDSILNHHPNPSVTDATDRSIELEDLGDEGEDADLLAARQLLEELEREVDSIMNPTAKRRKRAGPSTAPKRRTVTRAKKTIPQSSDEGLQASGGVKRSRRKSGRAAGLEELLGDLEVMTRNVLNSTS